MQFFKRFALPILILFHLIGWVGIAFINPRSFANLSYLNLLLSLFLISLCHEGEQRNFVKLFIFCWIGGYLVELLGISTGFPFGTYYYGVALGPRLAAVPLIIGVNWFLMTMGAGFLARKWISNTYLQAIAAALVMTLIDALIEQVAPRLDYWYWQNGNAPLMNYLGWFIVALVMQIVFQKTVGKESNKLAVPYLITVFIFFILLNFSI